MRSKLNILLSLVIVAALLTPGCAGAGQPDTNSTAITNASEGMYAEEFNQGFGHHAAASSLFNNATSLWDGDDYASATELLKGAQGEYAVATGHYHNMAAYTSNEAERAFAEYMEESAVEMGVASLRYMMSIDAAMADNDKAALAYFEEGQALVDRSMMALNQSLGLMPSCLGSG